METSELILTLAGVVTAVLGVTSVEGLTAESRARRRAKIAAEIVTALPEGSQGRSSALLVAEHEVKRWLALSPAVEGNAFRIQSRRAALANSVGFVLLFTSVVVTARGESRALAWGCLAGAFVAFVAARLISPESFREYLGLDQVPVTKTEARQWVVGLISAAILLSLLSGALFLREQWPAGMLVACGALGLVVFALVLYAIFLRDDQVEEAAAPPDNTPL